MSKSSQPLQLAQASSASRRPDSWRSAVRRVALGLVASCASAGAAHAATFTVTNTNASGPGSLHQAITSANATAAADLIEFNILGIFTFSIGGVLPAITQPVTIDGYTQFIATDNSIQTDATTNANIRIEIDGSGHSSGAAILDVQAGATIIRGLAIKNIPAGAYGIRVAVGKTDVAIHGNFVGTNAAGLVDMSSGIGIRVDGSAIVGTPSPGDRNLILGNTTGIEIAGPGSLVDNNLIGLDSDGGTAVGNSVGIRFLVGSSGNDVGVQTRNYIAANSTTGIFLNYNSGEQNRVGRNHIYDNGALGIDIGTPGPDFNDDGDADDGANGLLNYPDLSLVRYGADNFYVRGTFHSKPGQYYIHLYRSSVADPSGFGEGERYIGAKLVTISPGKTSLAFNLIAPEEAPLPGEYLTATAEEVSTGNTSEFSRAIRIVDGGAEYVVTNTAESGAGSLQQGLLQATEGTEPNTILFNIPGDGPHTIVAPDGLFVLGGGVTVIDGYSQPGSSLNTLLEGSNARLRIQVTNGNSESAEAVFSIEDSSPIIQGLAIHSGSAQGIRVFEATDAQILGNFIGTDITGTLDRGNDNNGITVDDSLRVRIGGPAPAHRNIISGNGTGGIEDFSQSSAIVGNLIGFGSDLRPLGNSGRGIWAGGDETILGGDAPGLDNRIGYNAGPGVEVVTPEASVGILGNQIENNTELGIDLRTGGPAGVVTPNDVDDIDQGPNALQNFPELTSVDDAPDGFVLHGTLDVNPDAIFDEYVIRVYASSECDDSGYGQGERFLGAFQVVIEDADETFQVIGSTSIEPGEVLTATASDKFRQTSEFSACLEVPGDVLCGDASGNDDIAAGDALFVLRTAVGVQPCNLCVCDVNGSGGVTSSDALLVLRKAVGQSVNLDCPGC
jgi:hypothetical protein